MAAEPERRWTLCTGCDEAIEPLDEGACLCDFKDWEKNHVEVVPAERAEAAESRCKELEDALRELIRSFEEREDRAQLEQKQGYAYVRDTYYEASLLARTALKGKADA